MCGPSHPDSKCLDDSHLQTHSQCARSSSIPRRSASTFMPTASSRSERSNSSSVPQPAKLFTTTYVRYASDAVAVHGLTALAPPALFISTPHLASVDGLVADS